MVSPLLVFAAVLIIALLAVISWMAFKIAKLHDELHNLYNLIAEMLNAGSFPKVVKLAAAYQEKKHQRK